MKQLNMTHATRGRTTHRSRRGQKNFHRRPRLEILESRRVLATWVVTNTDDSGGGSFRDAVAIAEANSGHDEIVFHPSLAGQTIALTGGSIDLGEEVTIIGPTDDADGITISGLGLSRILNVLAPIPPNPVPHVVRNVTFAQGDAGAGFGGAVVNAGRLNLEGVVITGSSAADGGAIYNADELTLLDGTRIDGNTATSRGGAIVNASGATLSVFDSTLSGNNANIGGGIYNLNEIAITRSTVSGNTATSFGGAIRNFSSSTAALSITDSTIAHNISVGGGGGIATAAGTVTVIGTTIASNTDVSGTSTGAGGISRTAGTLNLTNSVVGNNFHGTAAQNNVNAGAINGTNLANFTSGNPMLGGLQNNGGLTQTMLPQPGSPLIDAGNGGAIVSNIDQRGFLRVMDGNFNGLSTVDIGAAEFAAEGRAFIVDATGDSDDVVPGDGICDTGMGACSLRAAITETNALPNDPAGYPDVIAFDLGGGGNATLSPTTGLPAIRDAVVIDGASQPGFSSSPLIRIDGGDAIVDGLSIRSEGVSVRSLAVTNFTDAGIKIASTSGAFIEDNYVGLDQSGNAESNGSGIRVLASENNVINGNVISGNTNSGVYLAGTLLGGNTLINNFIGLNPSGNAARANGSDGVTNLSPNTTIGLPGQGNVISGNDRWGVFTGTAGRGGNTIQGNTIGLNFAGTAAIPNLIGVRLANEDNLVGGTVQGAENLISGNSAHGLEIATASANNNTVQVNMIGTDVTGSFDLGNGIYGVRVTGGTGNEIGGFSSTQGNLISGNNGGGVILAFASTDSNLVASNTIGTTLDGNFALGNNGDGIRIVKGSGDNTIFNNQISGNVQRGVATDDAGGTSGNQILGNRIGTNAAGTMALHNGPGGGVRILGAQTVIDANVISSPDIGIIALGNATDLLIRDNALGVTQAGATTNLGMTTGIEMTTGSGDSTLTGNTIANNVNGIIVRNSSGIRIEDNSIHDNSSIGIDLGGDGPTANDFGDNDTGANNLQNSPVLTSAILSGNQLEIIYRVDSTAQASNYDLEIEFFLGDGSGQGETSLGNNTYLQPERLTDKTIVLTTTGVSSGDELVATATDADGNTSEFSLPLVITAGTPTIVLQNVNSPTDVNNDTRTSLLDALLIINTLDRGVNEGEAISPNVAFFTDVNGGEQPTAIDALMVINAFSNSDSSSLADSERLADEQRELAVDDVLSAGSLF